MLLNKGSVPQCSAQVKPYCYCDPNGLPTLCLGISESSQYVEVSVRSTIQKSATPIR